MAWRTCMNSIGRSRFIVMHIQTGGKKYFSYFTHVSPCGYRGHCGQKGLNNWGYTVLSHSQWHQVACLKKNMYVATICNQSSKLNFSSSSLQWCHSWREADSLSVSSKNAEGRCQPRCHWPVCQQDSATPQWKVSRTTNLSLHCIEVRTPGRSGWLWEFVYSQKQWCI